jgi:hypothetical protein
MRLVSDKFKENIVLLGREIDSRITYGNEVIYGDKLFSIKLILNSDLLKSVMKAIEIECSEDLPLNSIIKYEFGLLVDEEYEWINYGNYKIIEKSYNEDSKTYSYMCYDKMVESMIDYFEMPIQYPINVREYINEICKTLNIEFKNKEDEFVNYDKQIKSELFLDENGESLQYTFRDVLDMLAEITASNIIINDNDELEIRYINDTNAEINEEYFKDINVKFGETFGPVNSIVFSRSADSDKIYKKEEIYNLTQDVDFKEGKIYYKYEDNEYKIIELNNEYVIGDIISEFGTDVYEYVEQDYNEIIIRDNQFLNDNDRDLYIDEIYEKLYGLQYSINDYTSPGILFFEVNDMYKVNIDGKYYNCLMLNDEITITSGINEIVYTDMPEITETDYNTATKTDKLEKKTTLVVDKVNQEIIGKVEDLDGEFSEIKQTVEGQTITITNINNDITIIKENISGLEIDFTKNGDNLVRNSMLWNYDGWLSNTFQPYFEGENPPSENDTLPGGGRYTYWYCTETNGGYENGIIYEYDIEKDSWIKTDILRKDFYNSAEEQKGISIIEDKENFLSGKKFNLKYIDESTQNLGIFSESFEISPTQSSISFQFKAKLKEIVANDITIAIRLSNIYSPNRLTSNNNNVVTYFFTLEKSDLFKTYSIEIPIKNNIVLVNNVGYEEPTNINNLWLDGPYDGTYYLKKYDNGWKMYDEPRIAKDLNGNIYNSSTYKTKDGVGNYYYLFNKDTQIKSGEILIVPNYSADDTVGYPILELEIGDIKVEYGKPTNWNVKQGESFGVNHKLDENGYTLQKGDNKLFLDEDEVTGYYLGNKMFYINKNEVFSEISKCIESNVNGLITKKININGNNIFLRIIREE